MIIPPVLSKQGKSHNTQIAKSVTSFLVKNVSNLHLTSLPPSPKTHSLVILLTPASPSVSFFLGFHLIGRFLPASLTSLRSAS